MTVPTELHASTCTALHAEHPLIGLARVHHSNRRSEAMSFSDKPFLIPLYTMLPTLREAVFCKAPQTGMSEAMIQFVLHAAGWSGRICAYVLPQNRTSQRFVSERLDPLLLRTPGYRARLPGEDLGLDLSGSGSTTKTGNLSRKRFGRGSILFLGSETPADFREFSADVMVVDEYDACSWPNVSTISDRIQESRHPQLFWISTPVGPRGIAKKWRSGSRGRWTHRCPRCGHRQALDWFSHFVERGDSGAWTPRDRERANDPARGDLRPVCLKCRRPWDRLPDGSCWVAEAPDRGPPSFHIHRLDVLRSKRDPQPMRVAFAEWVGAQGNPTALNAFFVGWLGWYYDPPGSQVTDDMLDRAHEGNPPMDHVGGDDYADLSVIAGVDVGSVLNVDIGVPEPCPDAPSGYRIRGIWTGTVPGFGELDELIKRYRIRLLAVDAQPEGHAVSELRDRHTAAGDCDVWLVQFHPGPRVGREAFAMTMKYDGQVATVDRTQLLDATMAEIEAGWRTWPGDVDEVHEWRRQMRAPRRLLDPSGKRYVWDEGSEPDHYRLSDSYLRVALELHDRSGRYFG